MRILFLSDMPPYDGGSGYSGYELFYGLKSLNYNIKAVVPIYPDRNNGETIEHDDDINYIHVTHKRAKRLLNGEGEPSFWKYVVSILNDYSPQLIICNGASFAPTASELFSIFNIPFFVIIRGFPVWQLMKNDFNDRVKNVIKAFHNAKKLVCVSQALAKNLFIHTKLKPIVIKNAPVVLNYFNNEFKNRNYDILFAATLTNRKNPFEAINLAKKIYSQTNVTLTISGQGKYKNEISDLIKKENLNYIRFIGFNERAKIIEIASKHKFVMLPSEFEGDPRIILESASMGTPALIPIKSWSEEIDDGIIKYASINEAALKLIPILHCEEKWSSLSNEAYLKYTNRLPDKLYNDYSQMI